MKSKKCNDKVVKQVCKKVNKNRKNPKAAVTGTAVVVEDEAPNRLAPEIFYKSANGFIKNFKRDHKRLSHLSKCYIAEQQEKIRQHEQELSELKKLFNNMQVEEAEIKRKRWCRYCEAEALYLSSAGLSSYCSIECEQYQNNLLGSLKSSKTKIEFPLEHTALLVSK